MVATWMDGGKLGLYACGGESWMQKVSLGEVRVRVAVVVPTAGMIGIGGIGIALRGSSHVP